MARYYHLIVLILSFCSLSQCSNWDIKGSVNNTNTNTWDLKEVGPVPHIELTDNFMIQRKEGWLQTMVGLARGFIHKNSEGCIALIHLRNVWQRGKVIAGDCSRFSSIGVYTDGVGTEARLHYPDHGYVLKNEKYVLFVDDRSCARRMDTSTFMVETIIGECGAGTLDMESEYGSNIWNPKKKVIGMVYMEEKNMWIFYVPTGVYIYSWDGKLSRKVGEARHASDKGGLLVKNRIHSNIVFQKADGFIRYDFQDITLTNTATLKDKTTKLFANDPVDLGNGNGHIAQNIRYEQLLIVTLWDKGDVLILNLFNGQIKKICEQTPQTDGPVIGVSPTQCKYGKLRNALWIGVGSLSAVIQDQENSKLYELIMYTGTPLTLKTACEQCLAQNEGEMQTFGGEVVGLNRCDDNGNDGIKCSCMIGFQGTHCSTETCHATRCNGNGKCLVYISNVYSCECDPGWKGKHCHIECSATESCTWVNNRIDEDLCGERTQLMKWRKNTKSELELLQNAVNKEQELITRMQRELDVKQKKVNDTQYLLYASENDMKAFKLTQTYSDLRKLMGEQD